MKKNLHLFFLLSILFLCKNELLQGQDEYTIWDEFIRAVKNNEMTVDKIKPYSQLGEKYKPILLGYLDSIKTNATRDDWEAKPEVKRVDDRTMYIVPWTTGKQKIPYCFSFITEGSEWYFQHMEAIFIRLDKTGELPATTFPDVSEDQKNWAREETYWSFVLLNVYLPIANEMGKEKALGMLRDGGGYFVGAKSWVPFASPGKAFILYMCWDQANLRGNEVELVKLEENEALIKMNTHYFALYFRAGHLRSRISIEDYKQIFETIWYDRAIQAGWDLGITYSPEYLVTFHFTRD